MGKIDRQFRTHCIQYSVSSVKQGICRKIICRSEPFSLSIRHRVSAIFKCGEWRQKGEKKPTLFLICVWVLQTTFRNGYLHYQEPQTYFLDTERESVKEIRDFTGRDALIRGKAFITVVPVNHAEEVELVSSLRWKKDILIAELLVVRHIYFCADMTFIIEIKVSQSDFCRTFGFWELLGLVCIEL